MYRILNDGCNNSDAFHLLLQFKHKNVSLLPAQCIESAGC